MSNCVIQLMFLMGVFYIFQPIGGELWADPCKTAGYKTTLGADLEIGQGALKADPALGAETQCPALLTKWEEFRVESPEWTFLPKSLESIKNNTWVVGKYIFDRLFAMKVIPMIFKIARYPLVQLGIYHVDKTRKCYKLIPLKNGKFRRDKLDGIPIVYTLLHHSERKSKYHIRNGGKKQWVKWIEPIKDGSGTPSPSILGRIQTFISDMFGWSQENQTQLCNAITEGNITAGIVEGLDFCEDMVNNHTAMDPEMLGNVMEGITQRNEAGKVMAKGNFFNFIANYFNSWLDTEAGLEGDDFEKLADTALAGRASEVGLQVTEMIDEALDTIGVMVKVKMAKGLVEALGKLK